MSKRTQRLTIVFSAGLALLGCNRGDSHESHATTLVCPAVEVDCDGACVSLVSNASHCGTCSNACLVGQICVRGACRCPGGGSLCHDECVDTWHDAANCGACDNACPDGHLCADGFCARDFTDHGTGGTGAGGAPVGGAAGEGTNAAPAGGAAGDTASGGWNPGSSSSSGGRTSLLVSPGCGVTQPPSSGNYTVEVGTTTREFVLDVPDDYRSDWPLPLVVAWHEEAETASAVADGLDASDLGPYYGLQALADGSAIFVAPEGIDGAWENTDGRDVAFASALVEWLQDELCIDPSRIFSVGFSHGGTMSNAIGCDLADTFRAVASISGSLSSGCTTGTTPIAMWGTHGTEDDVVPISAGREARDEFLQRSSCDATATSVEPSPCMAYANCTAEQPIVWCEWDGGHVPPDFAASAIWNFFSSLR